VRDQPEEHRARELAGEVHGEVALAPRDETVDQLVRDGSDLVLERRDRLDGEGGVDLPAERPVARRVEL
jgi:hypothetical protein